MITTGNEALDVTIQCLIAVVPTVISFILLFVVRAIVRKVMNKQTTDFGQLIKNNAIVNSMSEMKKYIASLPPTMSRMQGDINSTKEYVTRLTAANARSIDAKEIGNKMLNEIRPSIEQYIKEIVEKALADAKEENTEEK